MADEDIVKASLAETEDISANPFTENLNANPYASPAESGYLPPQSVSGEDPFAGLWRQGNLLVMHKEAPLPNICILSNQPATRRLRRKLNWHHPAIFLVLLVNIFVYLIVAAIVSKRATIHIPLTEEWFNRRRRRMALAWGSIGLCLILLFTSVGNLGTTPSALPLLLLAAAGTVAAMVYGVIACRLVVPSRITDHYIWLKGVHPDFLGRLPAWQWSI